MSQSIHTDDFEIRSYEVDETGSVTLPQVANYFQESAGKHAQELHLDITDLNQKGVTWVLYRMHIRIDHFPERWQNVSIRTWPSSGDGVRAYRDYELITAGGTILGVGVSQWMVLSIKSRRPMRMPEEILDMGLNTDEHKLPVDKKPFPPQKSPDYETTLDVSRYDLDMNNHVNNVKYIEWMTGFLPVDKTKNLKCRDINLQYHREAKKGDHIIIRSKMVGNKEFLHNITDASNGQFLAEGISTWETIQSLSLSARPRR